MSDIPASTHPGTLSPRIIDTLHTYKDQRGIDTIPVLWRKSL